MHLDGVVNGARVERVDLLQRLEDRLALARGAWTRSIHHVNDHVTVQRLKKKKKFGSGLTRTKKKNINH